MKWRIACWRKVCPKKIILFKHSDFVGGTKRSANPFKFGGRLQEPNEVELPWHLLISIARRNYNHGYALNSTRWCPVSSSLNVQLTDELRRYVDERASDKDVYATPSEYIRDLIRQDMQDRAVALNILEGMADLRHGRFSDKSILDLKEED
jgi:antitoxin ParD1/3/4